MKRFIACFIVLLAAAGVAQAAMIQDLDATISGSVTGNPVTQWADQSGNGNHAVPAVGSVYYPSTSLSESGLAGLDFGATRNSLELFTATESDSWLDQTSGNGFCVLIAFKCDGLVAGWDDLIGNSTLVASGFGMRWDDGGAMQAYLGGVTINKGGLSVAAGDTIVYAFNYNASTGGYEWWDSKNNNSFYGTKAAADFSTSNAVTVGSTTSSSRYINGMVGEIKVFDTVLSSPDFASERNAMVATWITGGGPVTSGWRVIPEDASYPTDDTIVAYCEVTDPVYNLPADPANTDCTAAFQAALTDAGNAGGGTVFVPAGQYRLDGTLNVGYRVTLRGRWREITASQPAAGTIIKVYNGQGNPDGTPLINGGGGAGVRDLTFWYPLQNPTSITPYPFVMSGVQTIENITFVNAYQGINFSNASMCHVNNVTGTVLHYGFYADQSAAISRFENINFGPDYWEWADLPDATPINTAYRTYMLTNGTGIDIRDMDGFHLWDCKVRGMATGLLFAVSPINGAGPSGGLISGLDIRDCVVAFNSTAAGGNLVNSYLQGTDKAVQNDAGLTCNHCTLIGGNASVAGDDGIEAVMTTINGVLNLSDGEVRLIDCDFTNTGTDVILGSAVDSIQIVGCTFADGPGITDNSPSSITKIINHNPVYGYSAPPALPPKNMSIVRKPYKTTLFSIIDYGATANGGGDDSTAFGAAIAAANANGGGIVFVPAGIFDVAGSYTLASGVELRGISASLCGADDTSSGSLLQVSGNEGNPTGPAFLNLSADCGVRGVVFHYNSQRADMLYPETIIAYPFTIRGTGDNIYISEVFMSNPYQGIHFYQANNHLLERCNLGGLNNTILVEECDNGRIGKFHLKPDFWRDIKIGDCPVGGGDDVDWYAGKHLTGIWLKNSTNEMVHSIFNHTSRNFMRVDNSSGLGDKIGGEVLQGGYRFSGGRDFSVVAGGTNQNNNGDDTGLWGYWLDNTFTGTVSAWNGYIAGTPGKMYYVQSGTLDVQQLSFPGWLQRGNSNIQVDSGAVLKLKMTGLGLQFGVYGCIFATGSTVSVQDTKTDRIPNTMLHHPGVSLARNIYSNAYISTSPNSGQIVNDGMILDPTNLTIEYSGDLYDYKEFFGARTTDGDYKIDVVDADFTNGASHSVDIHTYWNVDTDCTINVYYDSTSGKKLGKSSTFSGATTPDYQNVDFSVSDAQFDGTDDIVIEITGSSPLLNSVYILRGANAPTPNQATFSSAPAAIGSSAISMTATTGTAVTGPVQYYFDETSGNPGGTDSGWQTSPSYTDSGLNPSTQYTYTVQMRDSVTPTPNVGIVSISASATTNPLDTTPPTPNPATFSSAPAAISSSAISMTATTGTDATGPVQYYFDETSGNPGGTDSGWQTSPSYTDSGLNPSTQYTYTVQMRDSVTPTPNVGTASSPASATTWDNTPTFVAAGAVSSGTGTITPALPSGIATNDILLLFLETSNQAISISNQNGGTWTEVTNSPQYCGTAAGTTGARLTAFWSRYNGTQGAPTVSDSGDHQLGRIIAIRNAVSSGNPWDVTAGGVEAVDDTSGSIPGATTTVANTLVVTAIATSLPDASSTAKFSGWTNANLTSLTERTDDSVKAGNGGGLGIATGLKTTAGAYGNTAVTLVNAAYKGMMSIAIKP